MPVEALSDNNELAFLGTWVSEKLLGKETDSISTKSRLRNN